MSDQLENFIRQNKDQFNDLDPDPRVWKGVTLRDETKSNIRWWSVAWKVAAVIVIFIGSYFFHDYMSNRQNNSNYLISEQSKELEILTEAEAYYTAQIQVAESQIFQLTANNPELQKNIREEMENLDKIYKQLKEDLNDNVSAEEVIEAMIQNYRMKLMILEEVLQQLKKSNTYSDEKKIRL